MSLLDAISTAQANGGVPYLNGSGYVIGRVVRMSFREAGKDPQTKKMLNSAFSIDVSVLLADVSSIDPKASKVRANTLIRATTNGRFSDDPPLVAARQAVAAAKTALDGSLFGEGAVDGALAERFVGQEQAGTGALVKIVSAERPTSTGGVFTSYTILPLGENDVRLLKEAGVL